MDARDNMKGAGLMMASMLAFTLNDTFVKLLSGVAPINQVLFLRGVLTTILIYSLIRAMGPLHWRMSRRDAWLVALRVLGEVASAYFFITALFHMPLPNVTAILHSLPLTVTLAAAVFLGEPVGWKRLSAILVGFVGVLLIVRPGAADFTIYSIYCLAAVAFVTLRDLATRRLSPATPSLTVTLISSAAVMLFFGVKSITEDWAPLDGQSALYILGAGGMVIIGYVCSIMVMRVGEVGFTTPFRYTGLVWALLLGWFVFGDWPAWQTLLGAAIVVATGLFTLYRERVARKALARATR